MARQTTPINALPYYEGPDQPDGATQQQDLADTLDPLLAAPGTGSIGSRPAAGKVGRTWYDPDTDTVYFDTGSTWIALNQPDLGTIRMLTTPSVPTGWIVGDGVDRARADFPELDSVYAANGYPFGSGDGTTTFGVPNFDQTFIRGDGVDAIGTRGGEDTVALTRNQNGPHQHGDGDLRAASHYHNVSGNTGSTRPDLRDEPGAQVGFASGGSWRRRLAVGAEDRGDSNALSAADHVHGINLNSSWSGALVVTGNVDWDGNGEPHNNVPVHTTVRFIIRAVGS